MGTGRRPKYEFNEFKSACADGKATVLKGAMETAERDFGFKTQERVLDFIAEGGLELITHANTADLEKTHMAVKPVVDSYDFYSGTDFGYLAFWKNENNGVWIIKSFKANDKQDQRNFSLRDAVQKALQPKKLKKRDE